MPAHATSEASEHVCREAVNKSGASQIQQRPTKTKHAKQCQNTYLHGRSYKDPASPQQRHWCMRKHFFFPRDL